MMAAGRARALRVFLIGLVGLVALELALQAAHLAAARWGGRARLRDPGAPVILCLGDSHTYGAGVDAEDSYPAQLEAKLREAGYRVNVVNLGAPGYNTSELRRRLPEWLETYSPIAVIVLACVNNGWNRRDAAWSDAQDGKPEPWPRRLHNQLFARVLVLRGLEVVFHRLDWTRPEEETARDRNGGLIFHDQAEATSKETPAENFDRARRDLVAIVGEVRAAHALPMLLTYVSDPEINFQLSNQLLREVAAAMNAPLADNDLALHPLFFGPAGKMMQSERDRLFLPDMHPRGPGYEKIAENVEATLAKAGVLELLPRPAKP